MNHASKQDTVACNEAIPVLAVNDLHVKYAGETGVVHAVRGLSFELYAGESMAIVGESGAGKSATSLAVMGLQVPTAQVQGSVKLHGEELLCCDDDTLSRLRGRSMAMIFQDPLSALTPVYTVGDQIVEAIQAHNNSPRDVAMRRAVELLDLVGIPEPQRLATAFPHEYSGGMRQRAMIAMAIANDPDMIIADEPTTALDVTIQAQVLDVLKVALKETRASLILITHDLGVVAGIADKVTVMYAGRAVEQGDVHTIFNQPRMPYTIGLLGSLPQTDSSTRQALSTIAGNPPSLIDLPPGCPFAPRCSLANDDCQAVEPALLPTDKTGHVSACYRSAHIAEHRLTHQQLFVSEHSATDSNLASESDSKVSSEYHDTPPPIPPGDRQIVLKLTDMAQHYPLLEGVIFRRRVGTVHAVDGIDLELRSGETLGLVGESGCGKSTTVQSIMELKPPTRGSVSVLGTDVRQLRSRAARRDFRRSVQVVFQDPMASLDPRMPVFDLLAEPLGVFGFNREQIERRVKELLELVGLDSSHLQRYPQQLSGGQRQRIGIARALALEPEVVILDEPVSALDVSIRAGIINLLDELKAKLGLSYLFVAHDLAIVRHIADRVAVMYLGTIVEVGEINTVYDKPRHPYTLALLSATPVPDPASERNRSRILLLGELPSPANPPSGCRFHTRCPKKFVLGAVEQKRCVDEAPVLMDVSTDAGADHLAACHFNDRRWTGLDCE